MNILFPPLPSDITRSFDALPRAIDAALPLKPAHKRALPFAIAELSERLTVERGAPMPYWSAPRLTAAYVWYFLPWNLLRLARLLRGIDLPAPTPLALPGSDSPQPRILADMGSGPLTLPIALWLAKPEWRTLPLTVLCTDTAPHPLEVGRRLFAAIAPESRWRIVIKRAPADALRREIARLPGVPWLISAANVCNELRGRPGEHVFQRLESLVVQTASLLTQPDASALFVEPGTRLGGKTVMALRAAALGHTPSDTEDDEDVAEDAGSPSQALLVSSGPCTHGQPCPLRGGRSWCHFNFDAGGAPAWLTKLASAASLPKADLSLSYVHLRPTSHAAGFEVQQSVGQIAEQNAAQSVGYSSGQSAGSGAAKGTPPADIAARVLSAPFVAQGVLGQARYACSARGLVLLANAQAAPQGALVRVRWPATPRRDAKSGAWIADWE